MHCNLLKARNIELRNILAALVAAKLSVLYITLCVCLANLNYVQ